VTFFDACWHTIAPKVYRGQYAMDKYDAGLVFAGKVFIYSQISQTMSIRLNKPFPHIHILTPIVQLAINPHLRGEVTVINNGRQGNNPIFCRIERKS
jgi:hypothetical protein